MQLLFGFGGYEKGAGWGCYPALHPAATAPSGYY